MAGIEDLTTLPVVQDWLSSGGASPGNTDMVLSRLITTRSGSIMAYLQRSSFRSQTYVDTFDGKGGRTYFLNEWPVTSVQAVTVDGITVPASDGKSPGWLLQGWNGYPPGSPQGVELIGGYAYSCGRGNVSITYTAGYLISAEPAVVPATPFEVFVKQPQGSWTADGGVQYASGGALVLVTGTPSVGQYALIPTTTTPAVGTGGYQFAAADAAANVLISYSYVPTSVEEACMAWVGERYRARQRIGMRSQSIGGQTTTSYDLTDIPNYIKLDLQPYKKVLPI